MSMFHKSLPRMALLLFAFASVYSAHAAEPFRYPQARHGKGELKYIANIPVVLVEGTPAEMGEQLGTLALLPATPLLEIADGFIARHGWEKPFALVLATGNIFLPQFPPHHAEELDA